MFTIPEGVRKVLPFAFAGLFGLVAMGLAHHLIGQQRAALEQERQRLMANYPEPIEVVVASKDLPKEVQLDSSHLKMAKVPQIFAQPYAVTSPNEVLGRVTIAPISEGEQILTTKLRSPEEPSTAASLSGLTPQGTRAVTIVVDAITGVGGFIRPGDKVDILWTVQLPQGGQAQPVTLTLFQEIPVLAIGHTMAGQGGETTAEEAAQQHVTLALVPQETSLLLFARENGKIQLALRPRLETGVVAVPPASIDRLMERALGISPEAQQPPPARHVDVYRGLQHNRVVLSDKE